MPAKKTGVAMVDRPEATTWPDSSAALLWRGIAPLVLIFGSVVGASAQDGNPSEQDAKIMRSAGLQIIDRTFFSRSEGNLRGTIYFGRAGKAVQVAPERGTRRLKWGILARPKGLKGPGVCVFGDYTDISPDRSAVLVQHSGRTVTCTAVPTFTRIRNSRGNILGLGTIIQ